LVFNKTFIWAVIPIFATLAALSYFLASGGDNMTFTHIPTSLAKNKNASRRCLRKEFKNFPETLLTACQQA